MAKGVLRESGEIVEYSGAKIANEIKRIGKKRLSLLFEPDELEKLMLLKDAGVFATKAPVGAPINNSNTGANIGNLLLDIIDNIPGVKRLAGQTQGLPGYMEASRVTGREVPGFAPYEALEKATRRVTPPFGPILYEEKKR